MKFTTFVILLGFCLYLANAKSISDSQSDHHSDSDVESMNTDDDEQFEYGSDDESEDNWDGYSSDGMEFNKPAEDTEIEPEEKALLEKLRKNEGTKHASIQATDRLMKELRDTYRSGSYKSGQYGIELVDDSLYEWNIYLRCIDPDSDLYKDLMKLNETTGQDSIVFNIRFKTNFPFEPPFVRVISPIIQGGHITQRGAVCMELLTSQGWNAVYTVEAVIMQVSNLLVNGSARIPQQEKNAARYRYSLESALESFKLLEKTHAQNGWIDLPDRD